MARQSTTPVQFSKSVRKDALVTMTSGRAGKVVPIGYAPLLPGDSASGRVQIDLELAEMPKPLLNAVTCNVQAWFVPKSAHPQFSGRDEFNHAFTGQTIKAMGQPDRTPPAFILSADASNANREFYRTLGLHVRQGTPRISQDLLTAFNLVYNFRLAAHSSRLDRMPYPHEDHAAAAVLPPAFWPSSRFSAVVPDYERALVVGSLDLDVLAGRLPVSGIGVAPAEFGSGGYQQAAGRSILETQGTGPTATYTTMAEGAANPIMRILSDRPHIFAEMEGANVSITLADIDKARTTQAFAKLRTAYAGNDATGFDNDDTLVAMLMQGIRVPEDQFKRPWLLDSKRVAVGFAERFATDAANLDASVTQGRASAMLSLNVPETDTGGVIIYTVEVLPERIDERMEDPWVQAVDVEDYPNALRDIQRIEPVDMVECARIDTRHTTPNALYGYEPMNNKWNRDYTRLGGAFYQATPGNGFTENRSNIWQAELVDPTFSDTHYLAPAPFPHSVFSDTEAPAFEVVARHALSIVGLTQIGDVLAENNDDYDAVQIGVEE